MTNQDNDTHSLVAELDSIFPSVTTERDMSAAVALPATSWRFTLLQRPLLVKLSKFVVVGGIGVLVNTLALLVLFQWARLPLVIAAVMAAELAIVNNFCLNNRWTFQLARFSPSRLCQFHVISLGGLIINVLALWVLVGRTTFPYWEVNLVGIALATSWNFAANARWTWGGVA